MDDSEIVITKKLTNGGGSSVRIRIGGSARSPTEQVSSIRCQYDYIDDSYMKMFLLRGEVLFYHHAE